MIDGSGIGSHASFELTLSQETRVPPRLNVPVMRRPSAEILQQLAIYVLVVLLALSIHQFVVYSLAVKLLGGMSPLRFFKGIQEGR